MATVTTHFQTWAAHSGGEAKHNPSRHVLTRLSPFVHPSFLPLFDGPVLRYRHGQHYAHHVDFFRAKEMPPEMAGNNRVVTLLVYLQPPAAGGETIFPEAGFALGEGPPRGSSQEAFEAFVDSCAWGLKVKAKPGDAVLFFSQSPGLMLDPRSVHGGCPVEGDREKWVASRWIHTAALSDRPLDATDATFAGSIELGISLT